VLDGSPYLIDPDGRYDVELNAYFTKVLDGEPRDTQAAVAYDLKRWLKFLWDNRGGLSWREATPDDRAAFRHWRLMDSRGPRVDTVTWDREVATVNQFYIWAVRNRYVASNPIVQRQSRSRDPRRSTPVETPAESSHLGPRRDLAWLPPQEYRRWRDVGVRGFSAAGLPDRSFRGRFASRNGTYTDLMIRTGMRLREQTNLSLYELPELPGPGVVNVRSWLPARIAKGGSARNIYFPVSVLKDVWEYIEIERAEAVEYARDNGLYEQIRNPLIITDRRRPVVVIDGERLKVGQLDEAERQRVLIQTAAGLEPAALWLNEYGLPSHRNGWQQVFKSANARCLRLGLRIRAHPHILRHSFAVITLEQLWRGQISELATMTPAQRRTYEEVFGDPLRWVQMRLGHASRESTLIYTHTLKELEMESRMALIPDGWEAVGVHPEDLNAEEARAVHER
jgi:site-specific recombinase XerD